MRSEFGLDTDAQSRFTIRPRSIRLETSSACQLRCPSCPTTTGAIRPAIGTGLLKPDDLKHLLDANPELKRIELSNYGEIFLNPDLPEILRLCEAHGIEASAANGTNLNTVREEALEAVVRYRLRTLTVSIDGVSQATYAKYRVRGNIDTVLANITRINGHKRRLGSDFPVLYWQFIAFGHNLHEIPQAKAMAESLGMGFTVKLSWDEAVSPVENPDALRTLMPGGVATRSEYRERTGLPYLHELCHQLWDAPQVNWDGKMLGCCRNFWGDFGGNAFTDGLLDAVNNERMTHARAMLRGRAPPRDDIPCTTCDTYHAMRDTGRWIQRDDVANGQQITVAEGLRLAAGWKQSGRLDDARKMCRTILSAEPANTTALQLLHALG